MSVDLFAFSDAPLQDASALLPFRNWKLHSDRWTCGTKGWQVVVNASAPVESLDLEHVRTAVARSCPEARYFTSIHVEGKQSSEAMMIAAGSAHRIPYQGRGAIYDPQQDTLALPLSAGPWRLLAGPEGPEL